MTARLTLFVWLCGAVAGAVIGALVTWSNMNDPAGDALAPTVEPAPCPCVCPCVVRFGPSAWDCSGAVEWMPAEAAEVTP